MNPLDANLLALQQSSPQLAEQIANVKPSDSHYRVQSTHTVVNLEVWHDENWVAWHSRYDPFKEAQRELSSIHHNTVFFPVFMGIGLGYSLRALWDRWKNELYDILILEQDPHIFRLALENTKLDDILSHPRLHLQIGEDAAAWNTLCRKIMPGVMSSRIEVIVHPASRQTHANHYQSVMDILQSHIRRTTAEFDLTIRNGTEIQKNIWFNLPAITKSLGTQQIQQSWQGKPVVVAAAGPSLDKNIHHLCGMEDRVLIIAVDTAFRALIQNKITPHIIVSTDPTALNLHHFEGINPPAQTILAFDPEVYHGIPQQWQQRTLFLNLEKNEITRWFESTLGPFGYVPKGGSVGNTAFYLARIFGADPIIFVGLDLAFDPHGGKTHTGASVLSREINAMQKGTQTATLGAIGNASQKQEDIVWVPGTHHETVPTSQIMNIYIQQFNAEIQQTNARVIDATEGGALLTGTEILSLQHTLDQTAIPAGVHDFTASLQSSARDINTLQQNITSLVKELEQAHRTAEDGIALCGKVHALLHLGEQVRQHDSWLKMDACFQKIYHAQAVKIAMEQALFGAVFNFIRKEKPKEVETRLQKYHHYFQTVRQMVPVFVQCIKEVKDSF